MNPDRETSEIFHKKNSLSYLSPIHSDPDHLHGRLGRSADSVQRLPDQHCVLQPDLSAPDRRPAHLLSAVAGDLPDRSTVPELRHQELHRDRAMHRCVDPVDHSDPRRDLFGAQSLLHGRRGRIVHLVAG